MRTIVDLPDDDIKTLDAIGSREDVSRAELVRRAVADYLEKEQQKKNDALDQYFGFLQDCPEAFDGLDGVAYQEKIRGEWDDRDKAYGKWGLQESPQAGYDAPNNPHKKK